MGRRRRIENQDEPEDLGPCCVCERRNRPSIIRMLPLKASVPGTGWGCVVCEIPLDGAMALVCDECEGLELRFAIHGSFQNKQRIPIDQLKEPFEHTKPKSEH